MLNFALRLNRDFLRDVADAAIPMNPAVLLINARARFVGV